MATNTQDSWPKQEGWDLFAYEVNHSLMPVGSILAFTKNLTGVPTMPLNWVECNGQVISDSDSVYDGQTIPDLNATAGENQFLRGAGTSGPTGGATGDTTSFDHTHGEDTPSDKKAPGTGSYLTGFNVQGVSGGSVITILPPYYNVVWIMRIK